MGMAASQARFLQLTARKNNDEYMGQQINQARTALANKSAGLFEKMLALQPPTPPSSMDDRYYTQGYSFTDPTDQIRKKITTQEFNVANAPVSCTVSYRKDVAGVMTVTTATIGTINTADFMTFPVGSISGTNPPAGTDKTVLRYATFAHTAYDPNGDYKIYKETRPVVCYYDKLERLLDFQDVAFTPQYINDPASVDYYNPNPGTSVANPLGLSMSYSAPGVPQYGVAPTERNLTFTVAASPSILKTKDPTLVDSLVNADRTYLNDLSYVGQFDEIAFQEAMDRYEFEKNSYDYQIERINLETKQIQEQDKSLELKLKQIDTDHKAIETEMEAVSKVITKNIESTFKTFA